MTYRTPLSLLAAILLLALFAQSIFVVPQGGMGVILRFDSPTALGLNPGAHLKLPFLDKALTLDAGGIIMGSDSIDGGNIKFATADSRTLEAGYFGVWHIRDPRAFCAMDGCDEGAVARDLNNLVIASLRDVFASRSLASAVSGQQDLAAGLVQKLNPAVARLGVEFEDLQITDVSLPAADLEDIYTRMRSAEETRAAGIQAEGTAFAARKRAETDAARDQILAGADAAVARIRAAGEADAAAIYAQASRPDPDFFAFYRSLAVYRRSLAGKAIFVLDADSPFLKYLKSPSH